MTEDRSQSNDKIVCQCGCGEEIPLLSRHRGERRRFKHGHNQSGERNWQWKGGIVMHSLGYRMIMCKGHPRANQLGYVPEHTLVMEEIIGRPLEPKEEVHHKNEIRTDNRPENLQLTTHSEHTRLHNPMIDMSNRVCSNCRSTKTWGRLWRRNKWNKDNGWLCNICYNKLSRQKRADESTLL